jgi:hypothetical protein
MILAPPQVRRYRADMGPVMAFYQNAPRALRRLDQFDFDEKRLALRALQVKVAVGRPGVKLIGAIPRDLATTTRTSACPFSMHLITDARWLVFQRKVTQADSS